MAAENEGAGLHLAYKIIDTICKAQCSMETWAPCSKIIKTFKTTRAEHALNEALLSVEPCVMAQVAHPRFTPKEPAPLGVRVLAASD